MPEGVLLIEDDPVVRASVAREIGASGRFVVIAEASDVRSAREAVETVDASVAIVDLELRDGSALPLIPHAVKRGIGVIVLTIWDDDRVYRALKAGAGGYILKSDASSGRVADALEILLAGGAPVSPAIARRLVEDLRDRGPDAVPSPGPRPTPSVTSLTDREREVIELFAKGATYDEVAHLLDISVNTVRFHVRSMYRKLHVCTKAEAVTLAFSRETDPRLAHSH